VKGDIIYKEQKFALSELKEVLSLKRLVWLKKYRDIFFSFRHYGIDMGNETVIHFGGNRHLFSCQSRIKRIFLGDFLLGSSGKKVDQLAWHKKYSPDMIVERAKSLLETDFGGYDLLKNNCEHFVFWCATGKRISYQVPFIVIDNIKDKLAGFLTRRQKNFNQREIFPSYELALVNSPVKYPGQKGIWFATLENFSKNIRQATLEEIKGGQ